MVLNAVQAEVGDNGFLQSYLEDADVQVAHTGSDATATKLCHDKVHCIADAVSVIQYPHILPCITGRMVVFSLDMLRYIT